MKTPNYFFQLITVFSFLLLFTNSANAQGPAPASSDEPLGGPSFNANHMHDSIYNGCDKNSEGCYYRPINFSVGSNSRMSVHFSAYGPKYKDLALVIENTSGNKVKYLSKELFDTRTGTIDLDTTFGNASDLKIQYTTEKAGETMHFTADIFYASEAALKYQGDQNLCWKIAYILKNSENGFGFITSDGKDMWDNHYTTAPIIPAAPKESLIMEGMGSISYQSTIFRGTKEEAEIYFSQVDASMRNCMSDLFEYTTSTDDKGFQKLECINSASTAGADICNLSYSGDHLKPILPKYKVSVFMKERKFSDATRYEIVISVSNLFKQF